ncbi:hypothetical protein EV122DRAFT_295556 [Schizophyllum commune]
MPPLRRSARIRQQQPLPQPLAEPAPRGQRTKRTPCEKSEPVHRKRKRDNSEDDLAGGPCPVRSSNVEASTQTAKPTRKERGVRFAGGEPLEPIPIDLPDVEQAERAAAAAITAEFLANRLENAQYVDADVRTVHCPPEAVAKIAPTRTRDSKGRVLLQYPTRYILAFKMEVLALHEYFKAIGRDYRSVAGTMLFFLIQVQDLLSIRHGHGLYETTVMGKTVWTIIMSESDRPETLPYPTARIRIFQDIMESDAPPSVFNYRPTAHRLKAGAK